MASDVPLDPPAPEAGVSARCAHQIHVRALGGEIEAASVCSCPAGLIHMHDCPVENGLSCRHFAALEEEAGPELVLDERALEETRERLMADYLERRYRHRVRSLAPETPPFERVREDRAAAYAELFAEPDPDDTYDEEAYVRERDRLHERRRRHEEQRRRREEESRKSLAKERARLGIKTVVERAREAVAQSGNVASSRVDEVELEKQKRSSRKRRRKRRKRKDGDASPQAAAGGERSPDSGGPEGSGGSGDGRRRRRRRRRRKRKPDGPG